MRFVDDVSCHGVRGGLSSPQVKAVSITTLLGTNGALVAIVLRQVVAAGVAEDRVVPVQRAGEGLGVGDRAAAWRD